jgi:hypothetical protein
VDYRLSLEVGRELAPIDRLNGELMRLPLSVLHERWLQELSWERAVNGQNHVPRPRLDVPRFGHRGPFPRSRALGLRHANAQAAVPGARALTVIRSLHRLEMRDREPDNATWEEVGGGPGEWRREAVEVSLGTDRIYAPPPAGDVHLLMDALGDWIDRGADGHAAPVAAALAHLEQVGVHPFGDGNGHGARATARYVMRRGGHTFRDMVQLEDIFDSEVSGYDASIGRSLGSSYRRGYDATPFVRYFLATLHVEAAISLGRAVGVLNMCDQLDTSIGRGVVPAGARDPLVSLALHRRIDPPAYAELSGTNLKTAQHELNRLSLLGYARPIRTDRSRVFLPTPRLDRMVGHRLGPELTGEWPLATGRGGSSPEGGSPKRTRSRRGHTRAMRRCTGEARTERGSWVPRALTEPSRAAGAQSPLAPSRRSRIRSAWPLWRAYSSIMCT